MYKKVCVSLGSVCLFLFNGCMQPTSPIDIVQKDARYEEALAGSVILNPDFGQLREGLVYKINPANPYSVRNMTLAKQSLAKTGGVDQGLLAKIKIVTTHRYIRFKPANEAEVALLNSDSSLTLWDFPLDNSVDNDKCDEYRDKGIPEGQPAYLYTAVPLTQPLPAVAFDVLENLCLPPEEEEDAKSEDELSSVYRLLEEESMQLTGNQDDLPETKGKWRPTGSVKVYDDVLNEYVPVARLNVRTRNWFKWWSGYTDNYGKFSSSKRYRGYVHYSIRWQHKGNTFDIRTGSLGQAIYNGPWNSRCAWHPKINKNCMSWVYAHIYRAGSYYVQGDPFCGFDNEPFDRISVCAYKEKSPKKGLLGRYNAQNENVIMYQKDYYGREITSCELFYTAAHELSHAHHDEIYSGGSWWAKVSMEVIEGWACAVGCVLTAKHYSISLNDKNCYWYTKQNCIKGSVPDHSPLMLDLIESFNQKTLDANFLDDQVSGYTLQQLAGIIKKSGCRTLADFKSYVYDLPLPIGMTKKKLDDYFAQY